MGVNNRERRRAKKQKRGRQPAGTASAFFRPRPAPGETRGGRGVDEEMARRLVLSAAEAFRRQPGPVYARRLEALLAEGLDNRAHRALIDRAVAWWIERGLDRAWVTGWQPADVARVVRRSLSGVHAEEVSAAIATSASSRPENGSDDRWADQVAALRAHGAGRPPRRPTPRPWPAELTSAVEVVALLLRLPALPPLGPPESGSAPRRPDKGRSGPMLERVRALLAKAESTSFPAEAEALTAKAQELMARHAIDEAMLQDGGPGALGGVIGWRIGVEDPYAGAKSLLLARIADANRCRAVWCKELGFSSVFGTRADLEMVELLFTSLLVQGTEAMLRAGRSVDGSGRSRTRSFRQSFLVAYAIRIGERLAAVIEQAVAEGAARHGDDLLPVLAGWAEAVDDAVNEAHPDLVPQDFAVGNYSGWLAGRTAAEMARLGAGDELVAG